jgi:peptidyl-prolyl cis-trans isomerase B (cyclophilin B)
MPEFVGTPLLIDVREDKRPGAPAGPIVTKIDPLRYATITTDKGTMTLVFYFDVAPHTADSFLSLAAGGYYDGLTFHRVVPKFVIQGGDPRGDGSGGPGYSLMPEFNDRPHVAGALSMARMGDPGEGPGVPPRYEFASSAGSQFFICLDYEGTRQLDNRYTVFGKVIEGFEVAQSIANSPLKGQTPVEKQVMDKVRVVPVTPENNPYAKLKVDLAK